MSLISKVDRNDLVHPEVNGSQKPAHIDTNIANNFNSMVKSKLQQYLNKDFYAEFFAEQSSDGMEKVSKVNLSELIQDKNFSIESTYVRINSDQQISYTLSTDCKIINIYTANQNFQLEAKKEYINLVNNRYISCLLYTSPSPRDKRQSRMPSSA